MAALVVAPDLSLRTFTALRVAIPELRRPAWGVVVWTLFLQFLWLVFLLATEGLIVAIVPAVRVLLI